MMPQHFAHPVEDRERELAAGPGRARGSPDYLDVAHVPSGAAGGPAPRSSAMDVRFGDSSKSLV
jgi:hypothetical protein